MDWQTFRDVSRVQVRAVAPRTVMLCGAGTRRDSMLHGIPPNSHTEYFRWGLQSSCEQCERWFDHGVRDLFIGEAPAMWYQMPGYSGLTPTMIRRIIYETVYLQSTWATDKDGRYDAVLDQRAVWEQTTVLGFGRRMGGFWYPESDALREGEQL